MLRVLAIAMLSAVAPSSPAAAAGFVSLDLPGAQVVAMSGDGCVVAGSLLGANGGGFRWSAAAGVQLLDGAVEVQGLSPSGDHVAGAVFDELQRQVAGYWDAAGTLHRLAAMPEIESIGVISQALAVTDEPRIVGRARRAAGGSVAFQWTTGNGMQPLPSLRHGASSGAVGISADGRRVVGWERAGGVARGVLWEDGRSVPLAEEDGGMAPGEVLGASRSGEVVLGVLTGSAAGAGEAYRWRGGVGLQVLSHHGSEPLRFSASSDDGRVLVGGSGRGEHREPWLWREPTGAIALSVLAQQHGIAIPHGWTPMTLTAVSDDGQRLAGWGKHDGLLDSFVIDLVPAKDSPCAAP